jgi:hypothetical protein
MILELSQALEAMHRARVEGVVKVRECEVVQVMVVGVGVALLRVGIGVLD